VSARVQDARGATGDAAPALVLLSPEALAEHERLNGRVRREEPCRLPLVRGVAPAAALGSAEALVSASGLTIYVAGGSSERDAVAGYLSQLRAAGWTVTYDWTTDPGWTDPAHPRIESARADVRGITRARFFWYVAPREKSEGSHFELGVAWLSREMTREGRRSTGRVVFSSGPGDALGRVFPSLVDRHFAEHADALAHLIQHAGRVFLGDAGSADAYAPFPAERG